MTHHTLSQSAHRVAAGLAAGLVILAAACSTTATASDSTIPASVSAPPSTAPPQTTTVVDEARRSMLLGILKSHHEAGEFVGGRMALRDADGKITTAVFGTPTLDPSSGPVDLDTPWNVGSITKTFVAVVVLQLADEGRIDLDAGIVQYFPTLKDADRITPRELLQHTSGLNDYSYQPPVLSDAHRHWTADEMLAVAEAAGRVGEPGGAFHYSNTNYIVLGEIIEKVTGHPWDQEVRTRITEPLGMDHTDLITGQLASPAFAPSNGAFIDASNAQDPSLGGAAGAIESNTSDLMRYITALEDGTLLSPESQQAMRAFIPGEDYSQFGVTHRYGLGFEEYATDAVTVQGHMGTGAQEAFIGYDPANGTAVVVMLNVDNPGPQALMAIEALTAAKS
jgi:D-alanyl-D-alanine carboxypeptidase